LPEEKKKGNPLRVAVEPYNILPVDKDAFKGEIPDVKNLYPYAPFNLFIERKLFMHNMSHALTAYLGFLRGYEYIYQAIGDFDIKYVAYKALTASAVALSIENKADIKFLFDHAENLLYRFTNVQLGDTVERVGKDTIRKLSVNDRLIGALKLAEKHNVNASYICIGVAAGMLFNPTADERSVELSSFVNENGVKVALEKYSEYTGTSTYLPVYSEYTGKYVDVIEEIYKMLKNGKTVKDAVVYVDGLNGKEIKV
jgi:mannitol-1-phosphate 5-dehydrogenase